MSNSASPPAELGVYLRLINFLALKIPGIDRLAGGELQKFIRSRDQRIAQLDRAVNDVTRAPSGL